MAAHLTVPLALRPAEESRGRRFESARGYYITMPKKRLYQLLRDAGIGSTIHETKQIIRRGEVTVNQVVCTLPNFQCDPTKKKITVAGKEIRTVQEKVYFLLHKSRGYSCQKNERILFVGKLIPYPNLSPVGRLDVNTTGLLILTNDGELAARITAPEKKVEKTYQVTVDTEILISTIEKLQAGVTITVNNTPYTTKATNIKIINDNTLELTITEGKKRQIRLMMNALGYEVRGLQRIRIGKIELGNLKEGEYQQVSKEFIVSRLT